MILWRIGILVLHTQTHSPGASGHQQTAWEKVLGQEEVHLVTLVPLVELLLNYNAMPVSSMEEILSLLPPFVRWQIAKSLKSQRHLSSQGSTRSPSRPCWAGWPAFSSSLSILSILSCLSYLILSGGRKQNLQAKAQARHGHPGDPAGRGGQPPHLPHPRLHPLPLSSETAKKQDDGSSCIW